MDTNDLTVPPTTAVSATPVPERQDIDHPNAELVEVNAELIQLTTELSQSNQELSQLTTGRSASTGQFVRGNSAARLHGLYGAHLSD